MFLRLFKQKTKLASIKHENLNLKPLQAFLGLEGNLPVVLDFKQSNALKILATMSGGKSIAGETLVESLSRSTKNIRIIIISLSGNTDFQRFDGRNNYEFLNPTYGRESILERLSSLNELGQLSLNRMSIEKVRHAMELKEFRPVVIFVDELESCFPIEKDGGPDRKLNEQIINQLNHYFKIGRKLGHILIVGTQTQTLSASAVALRLMHFTLLGKAQTSAICNELGIPDEIGRDPSLKEGKFILLGLDSPKVIRVGRFK